MVKGSGPNNRLDLGVQLLSLSLPRVIHLHSMTTEAYRWTMMNTTQYWILPSLVANVIQSFRFHTDVFVSMKVRYSRRAPASSKSGVAYQKCFSLRNNRSFKRKKCNASPISAFFCLVK